MPCLVCLVRQYDRKIYIMYYLTTSMSEKKSVLNTKYHCALCDIMTDDFLELGDSGDLCFILCANCEAMSTCEDLYGESIYNLYANSRKGVLNSCINSRTSKVITSRQTSCSSEEKIDAN